MFGPIKIKLSDNIKRINLFDFKTNKVVYITKKCRAVITGNLDNLEYEKTIDDLINENKSFLQANREIKKQER